MAKRSRATGRAESGSYTNMPHALLQHPNWLDASPGAIKLFMYLASQYRGHNNGDLSCSFTTMKKFGWSSNERLADAIEELLARGLIVRTRIGATRGACHLFAMTFRPIDDSNKLDHDVEVSNVPSHAWKRWPDPQLWPAFQSRRRKRLNRKRERLARRREQTTEKVPHAVQSERATAVFQSRRRPSSSNTMSGACGAAAPTAPQCADLDVKISGQPSFQKIAKAAELWPDSSDQSLAKLSGSTLEQVQQWRAAAP